MHLLLFLIVLHLLSDFVFQSDKLVAEKYNFYTRSSKIMTFKNPLLRHMVIVFLMMQVLNLFFSPWYWVVCLSLLITISHLVLDHYKLIQSRKKIRKKVKVMSDLFLFAFDQVAHIGLIFVLSSFFKIAASAKYLPLIGQYKTAINNGQWKIPSVSDEILMSVIVVILFSYVAGFFISFFLDNLKANKKAEQDTTRLISEHEKKIGLKIGLIERLLVIIFVAANQYGALGLILAGKSLARYEDLKDKAFAEYYLFGTLLSFLFGVVGGMLVRIIW